MTSMPLNKSLAEEIYKYRSLNVGVPRYKLTSYELGYLTWLTGISCIHTVYNCLLSDALLRILLRLELLKDTLILPIRKRCLLVWLAGL